MAEVHDLTGQRFGRLVVVERHPENTKHGKARWVCKCDCGNTVTIVGGSLTTGSTKSCGCQRIDENIGRATHKMSDTRLYNIWAKMRDRCEKEYSTRYKYYGAVGISVCEEWRKFDGFYKWAISHGYREDLTIERIDVHGDYCPENCCWIPLEEQAKNKTNSRIFEYEGRKINMSALCRELGVNYNSFRSRLMLGYTLEEAINLPKRKKRFHKKP